MNIVKALDFYAAVHGDSAPLPLYMQYGVVIYALDKNFSTSPQWDWIEGKIMSDIIAACMRDMFPKKIVETPPTPVKQISDHRSHFENVVAFVRGYLNGNGELIDRRAEMAIADARQIADYLNCIADPVARAVMPSHVKAAQAHARQKLAS